MSPRWIATLAACATLIAAAAGLYWKGRHEGAAQEHARTEAAMAQAAVAKLEVEGARASAQRVEVVVRQREALAAAAAVSTTEAMKAEDALVPLDPGRAERLRIADRRLCDVEPRPAACPAAGNPG